MSDTQLSPTVNPLAKVSGGTRSVFRSFFSSLRRVALFYLAALTLAEALTTLIEPRLGLALHGLILISLLLYASLGAQGPTRRFLLCLALAPTIRLLSLSLPLPSFPFIYWYLVVGLPLFLAAIVAARISRMSKDMLGLNFRHLPIQLLVAITGFGLGYPEYLILHPDPLAPSLSWQLILVPALILMLFTGFLEELIFRGMMQYSGLRSLGRFGLWYVIAVFTVLHLGYRSALDMLFVFGVAVYFAWVTQRTGSILGVTLAHGLINVGLFLIFPFILVAPIKTLVVPQPVQAAQPPPGLLAPLPTVQTTRAWLTPTTTPFQPASPTATACQPPEGWVLYIIADGDTLVSLSFVLGTSVEELQAANCLGTDVLITGQAIFAPFLPNPTATPSSTPTLTVRPTQTRAPATAPPKQMATPTPPRTLRPTNTRIPPANTAVPPTVTPVPPTATPVPPTETSVPPTNTREPPPTLPPPPTNTAVPPTDTPIPPPPTDTPPPPPTDTPLPPPPTYTPVLPMPTNPPML